MDRAGVIFPAESFRKMANFVNQFYKISDTPYANEKYADQFNENGSAEVMGKKFNGKQEILLWRQSAWTTVKERSHIPIKMYTHGQNDIVVFGKVKIVFTDGSEDQDEFVANMEFDHDNHLMLYKARGLK